MQGSIVVDFFYIDGIVPVYAEEGLRGRSRLAQSIHCPSQGYRDGTTLTFTMDRTRTVPRRKTASKESSQVEREPQDEDLVLDAFLRCVCE